MKARKLLFLVLILTVIVPAMSALPAGIDLVVMVDTSASMFPVFNDLVSYLLRDILENRLRPGDTFHLLSFAGTAERELSENVEETSDLTEVIGRILLLKPLGQYTDLIGALETLYDYVRGLPEENRKLVLLLTDGIHDPPPDSPNRFRPQEALERLLAHTERIRREGWEIRILRTPTEVEPAAGGPEPGAQDFLKELAEGLETDIVEIEEAGGAAGASEAETLSGKLTGFATVSFPGDLGEVPRRFAAPLGITNFSDEPLELTLTRVEHRGRNLLEGPVQQRIEPQSTGQISAPLRLPASLSPGPQRLPVRIEFADPELRISPLQGELTFALAPSARQGSWLRGIPTLFWVYALAALVLIVLIILLIVFLRNRMADASFAGFYSGARGHGKRGKPILMRVREQNSQIGSRNIHRVAPRRALSVGGDGSSFLIYFVQMPRRIGEIRNDGKRFVFVPLKEDFFVELRGPLVDCLGKEIRALSVRGYPVVFSFHEYVSPLEEINRLMRSIHHDSHYPLKGSSSRS